MAFFYCGRFSLFLGRKTYVMGIVNATPDSFSGDGTDTRKAVERALKMVDDGADILDIGGESTRPGAPKIGLDEELRRVLPVVEKLAEKVEIPLSIDTTKAEVARRALEAGASIVNDISGATFDAEMLAVCAQTSCGLVLMHLRGTPQNMAWSEKTDRKSATKSDVIGEILHFWWERVQSAREAGISDERIALDAGFGFGKSVDENLAILRRGRELAAFGFPMLSGTSRKSTIGRILGGAPVEERLFGTAAMVALAITNGADIVRVHDVRAMHDVARVTDTIVRV